MTDYKLGILLVHGIGTQPAGDTITSWGDALVKTITKATRGSVRATVDRAGPDLPGGDGERLEARIKLHREGSPDETWLLAEGWWAESFVAPTYFEFCSWSVRALPWALAMHAAQRYWAVMSNKVGKDDARRLAVMKVLLGLLLAPFILAALFVILVLGFIPIPALRGALLGAQRIFTATVGDSLAFVESPVRSGMIKDRIVAALEALDQRCDKTVILAHSQGAAAAVEALGGITGIDQKPKHQASALITFGAGTNQLSVLCRSQAMPGVTRLNPLHSSLVASAVISGLSADLIYDVSRRHLAPEQALLALAIWGFIGFVVYKLSVGGIGLWRRLKSDTPTRTMRAVTIPVSLVVGSAVLALLYQLLTPAVAIPFAPVLGIVIALGWLFESTYTLLSKNWERIITTVRQPAGLQRWIDIHSSADPIAAGPTLTRGTDNITDAMIWNEGSLITDHVRYWNNLDGFVLRVVRACVETAGSPWSDALPPQADAIDHRANWRVSWLRLARMVFTGIAIGLGIALYHTSFDEICWLTDHLPALIVDRIARPDLERGTLLALIAVGSMAGYWLSRTVWRWWVRREQAAILNHTSPQGLETFPLIVLGTIGWAGLLVAVKLALVTILPPSASASMSLTQVLTRGVVILAALVTASVVSMLVFKRTNKPPKLPADAFPARSTARQGVATTLAPQKQVPRA